MDAVPDNTGACPGYAAVEWGRKRMIPRDKNDGKSAWKTDKNSKTHKG